MKKLAALIKRKKNVKKETKRKNAVLLKANKYKKRPIISVFFYLISIPTGQ